MAETITEFRQRLAAGDAKRDAGLTIPTDVTRYLDISYGEYAENVLDVYCPKGTDKKLPTIFSIHGGGWVYGDKELYSHYCMRLAQRGFTVVNFTYRLAPEYRYPAPLEDTCKVTHWIMAHAEEYFIDVDNIFMLGDSAGGQLCQQFLTLLTNPAYRKFFDFAPPENFRVNACALNCGFYFFPFNRFVSPKRFGIMIGSYFPDDYVPLLKQLKVRKYVTRDFPPAFVMTGQYDYLKSMAKPMWRTLKKHGVEAVLRIYGTKEQKEIRHVFHVNCKLPLAAVCNDDECAFFRAHLR